MGFEIIGKPTAVEVIGRGRKIRQLRELNEAYGKAQWRKLKGIATVRLSGGETRTAEVHWYEAHGLGRRRVKIKRFLD